MSFRPTSRRDFLTGKAVVRAAEDIAENIADRLDPTQPENPSAVPTLSISTTPTLLLHLTRRAMACEFQIYLNALEDNQGVELAMAGLDRIEQLEDQLSVYRQQSEICEINRLAALEPVVVESRLFALLQLAVELFQATGGAYDITSGPLTRVWGFFRRVGRIPTTEEVSQARNRVGSDKILLSQADQTISFAQPGVELNLGSIGKGYALDRCAEQMASGGMQDFLFHGGNSSVLARGTKSGENPPGGWTVGLRHPWNADKRLGTFLLRDRALGTSGSEAQFFLHQGRRYGHILDPRSGQPAEGVLTATVLAPTGALADALSTAFYVLGPERTAEYCAQHPEIGALLVCPGAKAGSLEMHRWNINDTEFALEKTTG